MPVVKISGESDDVIDVSGAVREEFPATSGLGYVFLSTGDAVRMRLEAEGWRAEVIHSVTGPRVERDGEGNDSVTVDGQIAWVSYSPDDPLRVSGAKVSA